MSFYSNSPIVAGAADSVRLVKYENVSVFKDANLCFTVMPVLGESVCPPQVMWSNLGIVSPPPMNIVLGHLRNLVNDGGFLSDWDYSAEGPVGVFGSMFRYLEDNFGKLSPRIKEALCDTPLVPIGR